ncbi:MAG TPA: antibiotic biosynthesis monooxygenase [Nitrososphaera sp.]|nr:antibiotic biosynthesis monooxygenase [Nitrososphaera sp.]
MDWHETVSTTSQLSEPESTISRHAGLDKCTFIAISDIELKKESVEEFKQWFSKVNREVLSQFKGFLGRFLIESPDGKHRIIVMTADKESFLAIRASKQHKELHAKALTYMTRPPTLSFYNIAAS